MRAKARELAGKPVAEAIESRLRERLEARAAKGLRPPMLAIVWVGENPASASYIRGKRRSARRLGIEERLERLPAEATKEEITAVVRALSRDGGVDGILVQAPLPGGVPYDDVVAEIDPVKDVDGFHPVNAGRLFRGTPGPAPCTAEGIMAMLEHYEIPCRGREAVVLGRSNLVGRPVAALLEHADATVSIGHSRTPDVAALARRADILVVAIGRPQFVTPDMVKEGACVIDVGIHREQGRLLGDVRPDVAEVASALSPVPGGVGPLTVAMLMANVVRAAETRAGKTT